MLVREAQVLIFMESWLLVPASLFGFVSHGGMHMSVPSRPRGGHISSEDNGAMQPNITFLLLP